MANLKSSKEQLYKDFLDNGFSFFHSKEKAIEYADDMSNVSKEIKNKVLQNWKKESA